MAVQEYQRVGSGQQILRQRAQPADAQDAGGAQAEERLKMLLLLFSAVVAAENQGGKALPAQKAVCLHGQAGEKGVVRGGNDNAGKPWQDMLAHTWFSPFRSSRISSA